MATGDAIRIKLTLEKLRQQFGITAPSSFKLPLAPATDHDIVVEGLATTTDIDAERMLMRSHAIAFLPWAYPPLLVKHDESRIAGHIDQLTYDSSGNLRIRATVTDPEARRHNAFSVRVEVLDYEIRDADQPSFYAIIRQARLLEVSLTDVPANQRAQIQFRHRVNPNNEFFENAIAAIGVLRRMTEVLAQLNVEPPPKPIRQHRPPKPQPPPPIRKPPTAFAQLVAMLPNGDQP